MTKAVWIGALVGALAAAPAAAQFRIGSGPVAELYQQNCAACHGPNMEGGVGGALVNVDWVHGGSDAELAASIADGIAGTEMIGFADTLSADEIRSLVVLIQETQLLADRDDVLARTEPVDGVFTTEHHAFRIDTLWESRGEVWSIDFLPGHDGFLATQRSGELFLIDGEGRAERVRNAPRSWDHNQGGLLDIGVHPDYEDNGWIYLSLAERHGRVNGQGVGTTKVVRGRITDGAWTDEETIFEADEDDHLPNAHHFGSRFVFADGYVFFSIGDRGVKEMSQDLDRPNGKIFRLHEDGRIPEDNPFVDVDGAYDAIWSYGHRNPQGMAMHPETGVLYASEHGPRGGDELNRIEPGFNYGWPVVTYGINYSGTPITDETEREGIEPPVINWTPSIAACGLAFYEGDAFPEWRNDLFAGGLSAQEVRRVRFDADGAVVEEEIILKNQGRVRDVVNGPDGLYVVVNKRRKGDSAIYRLVPADAS